MSGSDLPYRLRPNKYVDRELFAELVALLVAESDPDKYVYISMGGKHLSDHLAIYRRAGITNLYTFDYDPDIADRQRFNVPFEGVKCENHSSVELPPRLEDILDGTEAKNVIVWLDFTAPKHYKQLREIEALVTKLQVGDVLRVTMNIDFARLDKSEAQLSEAQNSLPKDQKLAVLLSLFLKEYLPREIISLDYNKIPSVIARSIERACVRGVEAKGDNVTPVPILLTEYRDSTRMMTAAMIIADGQEAPQALRGWKYLSTGWLNVERIIAPDLSPRERYALDKKMHSDYVAITDYLGFELDPEAIQAYKRFHRFYPAFQSVGD